jgi:hypothetical protein
VVYEACKAALWQIQLAPKKDTIKQGSVKREDNGREFKKQVAKVS